MNTAIRFPQKVGCFKVFEKAKLPHQATPGSACYDLYACVDEPLKLNPRERVLVPTGLIMDIPHGYSVRIHTRSGTASKKGIGMSVSEGIIDSDYKEEVFALIRNNSGVVVNIEHEERICQGELVKQLDYSLSCTTIRPTNDGERTGGFGSTGEK